MGGRARWVAKYGHWAVVTGASDGIGRAMAIDCARRGLNVFLVARRQDRLDALAGELRSRYGIETQVHAADLSSNAAVKQVLDAAGDVDVGLFVACAGYGTSGAFTGNAIARELDMLDVNCRAVLVMTHAFAERFTQRGRGGIVLMGSLVGFQGVPYAANYAATKAYVQTLAEGLRPELADKGVDVLAVAPGPVSSGFGDRADMKMGASDTPRRVARGALNALGRKTTARPGLISALINLSMGPLPRSIRTRIMAGIMGGMTKHQR